MIKRIIQNEIGGRLEVIKQSGLVGFSAEIGLDSCEFLFDNDEDVHCFISELQGAMLRAKGEKKEEESNEEEEKFAVDTGKGKLVDPIDLKIPNDNFKLDPTLLCGCGRVIGTDRCTRLGCDNFNAFGVGTVDTTSNGTE